ncbi:hypothetical protein [Streptomyces luteogriseus]
MTRWQKNTAWTLTLYALVVLMLRFTSGEGWGTSLLVALVVTPLALWMG